MPRFFSTSTDLCTDPRQELTYGPGVTNVKGPAVPEAQIEVLVLHCALAD
jgi:hypothetical protein